MKEEASVATDLLLCHPEEQNVLDKYGCVCLINRNTKTGRNQLVLHLFEYIL